jgi:serine/threonine-protein kinase
VDARSGEQGTRAALASTLPAYDIGPVIGRGAFGVVFEARHRYMNRPSAIKVLADRFRDDGDVRKRLQGEAQVLAQLNHPHVLRIFDYVEDREVCALVMELLEGGTVKDRVATTSGPQACAIVLATLSGLGVAHRGNPSVLHRDVKPANLLFTKNGVVKVADFGVARIVGGDSTFTTASGELIGTPMYMAPEQVEGHPLTPAVDVYATGVLLYELLAHRPPFSSEGGYLAVARRRLVETPAPPPFVPAEVAAVTMRAMAQRVDERYPTADAFAEALALAAAAAYGPDWWSTSGVPLKASDTMDAIAKGAAAVPQTSTTTVVAGDSERVRSTQRRRTSHLLAGVAAVVLLVVALVYAFSGMAEGARPGHPPGAGMISIAGHDLSRSGTIRLDLGRPVPVQVDAPERVAACGDCTPTAVALSLWAGGVRLGTSEGGELIGGRPTLVSLRRSRLIAVGRLSVRVRLQDRGRDVGRAFWFRGRTSGLPLLTLPAAIAAALVFFAVVLFGEGRRRLRIYPADRAAVAAIVAAGGVLGVVTVLLAWVIGRSEPSPLGLAVGVLLGAGAGWAAAHAVATDDIEDVIA